jgi:hypothetical protein
MTPGQGKTRERAGRAGLGLGCTQGGQVEYYSTLLYLLLYPSRGRASNRQKNKKQQQQQQQQKSGVPRSA